MKIIAYDLGTGGNKASLFDGDGTFIASAFIGYETSYPRTGFHEQAPEDWYRAVADGTRRLLAQGRVDGRDVAAVAISGHSLGVVPLDRQGRLLRARTPIWSDRRADEQAASFFRTVDPDLWYRATGNGFPAAHYSAFKMMWYRDHEPDMFRQMAVCPGTKDYVNYRLTGNIATDPSYASGSGVYDLVKGAYDERFVEATGLDGSLFPEIVPATRIVGTLTREAAAELGLTTKTVVAAGGVDNSCMALGAGAFRKGRLYMSCGSSSWIAVCSDAPVLDVGSKPYVFAHVVPGMYAAALAVFASGTTFRWIRDRFCRDLVERAAKENVDVYDLMTEEASHSPVGANGLVMNPSLGGGSLLDPTPLLRGGFVNLDLAHTRGDIVRACMEGIAMNMRIVLDALRDLTPVADHMITVGGGANSALWRQMFADVFDTAIEKTNIGQNAASLGAAALAARAAGLWPSFDRIDQLLETQSREEPCAENVARYKPVLEQFKTATALLADYARSFVLPTL